MMRMLHGLSFRYRGERCCPPINRNLRFGFMARTSIPEVASAESVSCIRFYPKGSGRPERAVSGTQSRVSLCFQAIFLTPLRQLPSFVQISFALPPHAIIRLASAEPPCAAACLRTGAASDGPLPTTASSSGHALPTGRRSSPAAAASWSTTTFRFPSAAPAAATGCPSCMRSRSATAAPRSTGTGGNSAASSLPPEFPKLYAITLSHSRTSFDRNRWQLSRVIFTACLPSLIHCSAVPALVVEPHHRPAVRLQVGHDESHAREQLAKVELHLRHHPPRRLPTRCLVEKTLVPDHRLMARPSHRPRQQLRNVPLQALVSRDADSVLNTPFLQRFVDLRLGEGCVSAKDHLFAQLLLPLDLR